MGNWKRHYSSKHLDSADLDGKTVNIKILSVGHEEVEDGESKMLITFEPSPGLATLTKKRTWMAAKTCGYCLQAMFGHDDDNWRGKWVTIRAQRISTGDDAIRIVGSPDISKEVTARVRQFGAGKQTIKLAPTKATAPTSKPASAPPADDQDFGQPPPVEEMEPGANG